jgi:hypothetical protein
MHKRPYARLTALAGGVAVVMVLGAASAVAGCLPHTHTGKGWSLTKASAERRAIHSWCRVVRSHDGTRWTYFGLDASVPTCRKAGMRWRCAASAQPCRPSSGGERKLCVPNQS